MLPLLTSVVAIRCPRQPANFCVVLIPGAESGFRQERFILEEILRIHHWITTIDFQSMSIATGALIMLPSCQNHDFNVNITKIIDSRVADVASIRL
jgi:hypothetical protein